jgi:cysteine-rich repeat protein
MIVSGMRVLGLAAVAIGAAGCIDSSLVDCGDGRACPVGTVCARLIANDDELCARPDQLEPCAGSPALASCEARDASPAACYESDAGLVCLASGCGNRLLDVGEVCDDGNAVVGDGCSVGCMSNETCGNGVVDPLRIDGQVPMPNEQCDDANLVGHDGCASDCQLRPASA